MKTSTILSLGAVLLSISVASFAGDASARTFSLDTRLSPSHLHAVCDQNGGAFGMAQDGAGVCMGKSGNTVSCSKQGACVGSDGAPKIVSTENNTPLATGMTDIHPIVKKPTPASEAIQAQGLLRLQFSN